MLSKKNCILYTRSNALSLGHRYIHFASIITNKRKNCYIERRYTYSIHTYIYILYIYIYIYEIKLSAFFAVSFLDGCKKNPVNDMKSLYFKRVLLKLFSFVVSLSAQSDTSIYLFFCLLWLHKPLHKSHKHHKNKKL